MVRTTIAAVLVLCVLAGIGLTVMSPGDRWSRADVLLAAGSVAVVSILLGIAWVRRKMAVRQLRNLRDSALW